MTCTPNLLMGAKKHSVALQPQELARMTPTSVTVLDLSDNPQDDDHDEIRRETTEDMQNTWIMCAVHFFLACFMYGLGAYAFVRYVFNLLHMADGLGHVDTIMRQRYGPLNGVDWSFFGPIGIISVSIEMYALGLTFLIMVRQHDAIAKLAGDDGAWDRFVSAMSFVTSCGSLFLILLFFYFATLYHYMIIHKVLSLSPNPAITLAIFNNSTYDLIRPGESIFV